MPELPPEVWDLIHRHRAATLIQVRWLRYSLFGHVRKPSWNRVRCVLKEQGLWPTLTKYSMVRREWRTEPESWLYCDEGETIQREAIDGAWGFRTGRL